MLGSQSQPKAGRQIQNQEQVRMEAAEAGVIVQCSMGNSGTAVLAGTGPGSGRATGFLPL